MWSTHPNSVRMSSDGDAEASGSKSPTSSAAPTAVGPSMSSDGAGPEKCDDEGSSFPLKPLSGHRIMSSPPPGFPTPDEILRLRSLSRRVRASTKFLILNFQAKIIISVP